MEFKDHFHPIPYACKRRGRGNTKTMLAMKLTGILLMAAILQVSAHGRAQTVTYSARAELTNAVRRRYSAAAGAEKRKILAS